MVNKKGLIRIIEASIAILIIFAALFIVFLNRPAPEERDLGRIIHPLLEQISQDNILRNSILDYDTAKDENYEHNSAILAELNSFLDTKITNPSLNYIVKICGIDGICALPSVPTSSGGEIFAEERIISTTIDRESFTPKKIKLFLWQIR